MLAITSHKQNKKQAVVIKACIKETTSHCQAASNILSVHAIHCGPWCELRYTVWSQLVNPTRYSENMDASYTQIATRSLIVSTTSLPQLLSDSRPMRSPVWAYAQPSVRRILMCCLRYPLLSLHRMMFPLVKRPGFSCIATRLIFARSCTPLHTQCRR